MPIEGRLTDMIYVPGDLFSVNDATVSQVPNLFARNERLVALFETPAGPMAMVLVGAMIVAGIETVWSGQVSPPLRRIQRNSYPAPEMPPIVLAKGEEMGRFKLGSTVILLFGNKACEWHQQYAAGQTTRLGEAMATLSENAETND